MTKDITIRVAEPGDAEALLAVYAPYVTGTAVTFEYEVPTVREFEGRIRHVLEKFPYLVAEQEGEILGYAYASSYHPRAAYAWAVETSIYIRQDCRQCGIGRALYTALEKILAEQNILNLYAKIAFPEPDDEYLTEDSIRFHAKMGYREVAKLHRCGFKFHRWYHMVTMEKYLGEHTASPLPVKPFPEINLKQREEIHDPEK